MYALTEIDDKDIEQVEPLQSKRCGPIGAADSSPAARNIAIKIPRN
jgi:hypothetical protein